MELNTTSTASMLKYASICLFVCLCWGLTSQSTIFQSCRDGATASWVINQYFRGVKCLAQGHNMAAVGLEPPTSRSEVRHSTTEPPCSPYASMNQWKLAHLCLSLIVVKKHHKNGTFFKLFQLEEYLFSLRFGKSMEASKLKLELSEDLTIVPL